MNELILRGAVDFIERHPEAHRQGEWLSIPNEVACKASSEVGKPWDCGTTGCLAGWVVSFDGWKPVFPKWAFDGPRASVDEVTKDGKRALIMDAAKDILGITGEEAEYLFSAGRTVQEMRDFVETGKIRRNYY